MQASHIKAVFLRLMVQIDYIAGIIEDNRGITFFTTDNKNGIFASVHNDGIGCRFVHTKLKSKIVIHAGLLPTDTLHHPAGQ